MTVRTISAGPRRASSELRWRLKLWYRLLGAAGWLAFIAYAGYFVFAGPAAHDPSHIWLYDWNVHYAGALDFVERDLYVDGGIALAGLELPVTVFNLPPMAAAVAVPLVPFGRELGGTVWLSLGVLSLMLAALATFRRLLGTPWAWVWPGVIWLIYVQMFFFGANIALGNMNNLMLVVIVAFVWAHLAGRQRLAGLLLGGAIALKVWPITLGFLLLRERRWQELRWAMALLVGQGLAVLAWLGPDSVIHMVDALRTKVPIEPGVTVMWLTWIREQFDWWPALGSIAVVAALLAIPARGRLGIGLGLLAGLSLIANIWDHYLPTFVLAGLLMAAGLFEGARDSVRRWEAPARSPGAVANEPA